VDENALLALPAMGWPHVRVIEGGYLNKNKSMWLGDWV